jgi:hypothetical protein
MSPGWSPDSYESADRRRSMSAVAAGAVLLFVVSCLCPASAMAQFTQTLAPEGYVDREGIWPSPAHVRVCWEPAVDSYATEKAWVKQAVEFHIERVSSVRFESWAECTDSDRDIKIKILDERPRSEVGRQWARNVGVRRQDAWGNYIQVPTAMVLNFKFLVAFSSFCRPDREHCIRAIAVHEFLHAIGFLHEQLNPKASAECKERFADQPDFMGFSPVFTEYDPESHMNYCANMFRKPICLSEGDIQVLNTFYATTRADISSDCVRQASGQN